MANLMAPNPRCTYKAEKLVAMQRQSLANPSQSKQQARSRNKVLATVPQRGTILRRSLSANTKKYPSSSSVKKTQNPGLLFVGHDDDGPMISVREKTEEEKKTTKTSSTKKQRPGLQRSSNHASNSTLQTASSRTLQTTSSRTLQNISSRTLQTQATTSTRTIMDDHSISTQTTATMAQSDMTPPLHIPGVFRPAVGCIQSTDFLIRCFIARLRVGVMVYKHNRSRFTKCPRPCRLFLDYSKDRQTMLVCKPTTKKEDTTADADGAGAGFQTKRLNLLECKEVRLALSADSSSPRFTGTAVLRQKCEASDAHKSFSLVFGHRTLDITAITQDQCRMLTEGFSALCYRLHAKKQAAEEERKERFAAYRDPIIVNDYKENETRTCLRRRRPSI